MREQTIEYRIPNLECIKVHSKFCIITAVFFFSALLSFAQKNKKYSEDLSQYRPRVELVDVTKNDAPTSVIKEPVAPKYTINTKIDAVLDSIDRFNLTRRYLDGFSIQIYSGQKRDDAMNAKKKMQEEVPNMNANLQYLQPKFKVTVGKYFTRLEAQRDLQMLRRKFPNAILVPERILIR
jgi:SPOR domain